MQLQKMWLSMVATKRKDAEGLSTVQELPLAGG